MYRHLRKSIEGEAVQFKADGSNDSTIASWFGLHPQRIKETNVLSAHTLAGVARRVRRGGESRDPETNRVLWKGEGDWLIRTRSGGLYVCSEGEFATHYAKKDEMPAEKPRLAPKPPEPKPKAEAAPLTRPRDPEPNWRETQVKKPEPKQTFRDRLMHGKKK